MNKELMFDLDGTLTDSGPGIIHSVIYALQELGYPVKEYDALRTFVGPPLQLSFRSYGIREDQIEEAIALYRVRYHATGKLENTCYEGIRELLERLCRENYTLYVATSKPEELAKEILQGFGLADYFAIIAGASWDHSRENKDDVIRYLLDQCPGKTPIMIGDTVFDVVGAGRQNLDCIGVAWGYGNVEEMLEQGAKAIARTPEELYEVITAMGA